MELLKLNVGCGFDHRPGYVNVDLHAHHAPDLVCDATWLKPIEDSSCGEVVAQDVLEHIPRAACLTALREWNRVLAMDGRLWVRVPSLRHLLHMLEREGWQDVERQQHLIQCCYGTQSYEEDFHQNGFTEVTLRHLLAEAGFGVSSIGIRDEWLFEVSARKVSHRPPDPILRVEGDEEFVTAAYRAILGRDPDREGLDYHLRVIQSGIRREAVLGVIEGSEEARARRLKR